MPQYFNESVLPDQRKPTPCGVSFFVLQKTEYEKVHFLFTFAKLNFLENTDIIKENTSNGGEDLKKLLIFFLIMSVLLSGCGMRAEAFVPDTKPTVTQPAATAETQAEIPADVPTEVPTEEPRTEPTEEPVHSEFYIPGVEVDEVIFYFAEVCLDAEIIHSGDASVLQKWRYPVRYLLMGEHTLEDLAVLNGFESWLNTVEGFPGMVQTQEPNEANLRIHFCSPEEMTELMGNEFGNMDGAVTFWYNGSNEIYDAIICCRTDLDQNLRNSVILEELYNSMGPVQDTEIREDSIIYSEYSEPQSLTQMDELILKLLYHPMMEIGMNIEQCGDMIRQLYY